MGAASRARKLRRAVDAVEPLLIPASAQAVPGSGSIG